ncbi:MAG: carbon-nitrogen hydrolase family protein [Pseudomonadota bacterium]
MVDPLGRGLRVAVFQRHPRHDDVTGCLAQVLADMRWCEARAVDLAVFPEGFLQGYSYDRQVLARRALALDGEVFQEILARFASSTPTVVLGVIERRGDRLYNSAAVVRAGKLLGVYAKTHPNEDGIEPGRDTPLFEACGWPFGVTICNDANFAEPAMGLSRLGARLLCCPLNNMMRPKKIDYWRTRSLETFRQRAIDTGCWIASADVVGRHEDWRSIGCSCIFAPDGRLVTRVAEGEEGVALLDLAHGPGAT